MTFLMALELSKSYKRNERSSSCLRLKKGGLSLQVILQNGAEGSTFDVLELSGQLILPEKKITKINYELVINGKSRAINFKIVK
jgi:hypothetical protein